MKHILLFILIAFAYCSSGCKKDKTSPVQEPVVNLCDSITPVSFINDIDPILNANNCYACHNSIAPIFSDYSSVFDWRDSILKSIQHDPSYRPMPENGSKLPDSLINKVQCWIESGAPNN